MKKIYLELTPFFPNETSFRGPYIFDQVKAITKLSDYDVIVIKLVGLFNNNEKIEYNYQGVKVYVFTVFDLPSSILPGLFHVFNYYRFKKFITKTIAMDIDSIDVIHSHSAYPAGALGNSLGNEYGLKHFVQFHGLDILQEKVGRLLKGWLKKVNDSYKHTKYLNTINNADLTIGVSNAVLTQLQSVKGNKNNQTYTLYNGVDVTKFYDKKNKSSNVYTIGCISNFGRMKDQVTLLKALNILVKEHNLIKIRVIFIGTGETFQSCKQFVSDNQLDSYVTFKDEVDHTNLNDFYNTLDLFVLPSYFEALGCVYMEALQVGLPIIGIKEQGIDEIIHDEDKNKFLIHPGDYIKLSELIQYHINNKKKYNYNLNIETYIKNFLLYVATVKKRDNNGL